MNLKRNLKLSVIRLPFWVCKCNYYSPLYFSQGLCMRFFLFYVFILNLAFSAFAYSAENKTTATPQNMAESSLQPWLLNQIIEMQKDIAAINQQINTVAGTSENLEKLRSDLASLTVKQAELLVKLEDIDGDNKQRNEAYNQRLSDVSFYTNMWGSILSVFGVIITLAAIAIGFSVRSLAKQEAKQEAENEVARWINVNGEKIISDIKSSSEQATKGITDKATAELDIHIKNGEQVSVKLRELLSESKVKFEQQHKESEEYLERLKHLATFPEKPAKADIEALNKVIEEKAEEEYSIDDWFNLATKAYYIKEYESALTYLNLIIESEEGTEELIAQSMLNKGAIFSQQKKFEEEIDVYDEVVNRFTNNENLVLQEQVARALVNKGVTLGQLKKLEEEIEIYDKVINIFADNEVLTIQERVAQALFNKGVALGQLKKFEEGIEVYDEVVNRFSDNHESLAIKEWVAKGLFNKGGILEKLEKFEEGIEVYDEVVNCFADDEELALQEQVAKALVNKGVVLAQLEKLEEEINAYDEVVNRYADSEASVIQEQVAKALVNKGIVLCQLKKFAEGMDACDEVINRFADNEALVIQEQVVQAFVNKGWVLGQQEKPEEAIDAYGKVASRFADNEVLAIQKQVVNARVAIAELALLVYPEEEVLAKIVVVEQSRSALHIHLLIMKFLRFLLNKLSAAELVKQIDMLAPEVEFNWSFNEIRSYFLKVEGLKKRQLDEFVMFFEKHHDIALLKKGLNKI